MINNKKCLLVVSIVSALSGCASLDDSPYYRSWHDKAYGMRDFNQGEAFSNKLNKPMIYVNKNKIPEAEPQSTQTQVYPEAEPAHSGNWTDYNGSNVISSEPTGNNKAYAVEDDPFKAYSKDSNGEERIYKRI